MAEMFKAGATLVEIGKKDGVTKRSVQFHLASLSISRTEKTPEGA